MLCFLLFLVLNAGLLTVYFDTDEIDDEYYLRIKTEMAADSEYIFEAYGNDPESETCKVLYQEYMACSTYDVYLENVIADARGNTQISIFQTKFAISNLEQTEQDFKKTGRNGTCFCRRIRYNRGNQFFRKLYFDIFPFDCACF